MVGLHGLLAVTITLIVIFTLINYGRVRSGAPSSASRIAPSDPPIGRPCPIDMCNNRFSSSPRDTIDLSPTLAGLVTSLNIASGLINVDRCYSLPNLRLPAIKDPTGPSVGNVVRLGPAMMVALSPLTSASGVGLSRCNVAILRVPRTRDCTRLYSVCVDLYEIFFNTIRSESVTCSALRPLSGTLGATGRTNVDHDFVYIRKIRSGNLVLSNNRALRSSVLDIFNGGLLNRVPTIFVSRRALDLFRPDMVFTCSSISHSSVESCCRSTGVVFLPRDMFSRPSMTVARIVRRVLKRLRWVPGLWAFYC